MKIISTAAKLVALATWHAFHDASYTFILAAILMRCDWALSLLQSRGPSLQIAPVAPECLEQLSNLLLAVCKNPTVPGFNHFLFESVAALIANTAVGNQKTVETLEGMLFPAFQTVLSEDVQVPLMHMSVPLLKFSSQLFFLPLSWKDSAGLSISKNASVYSMESPLNTRT